MAAATTSLLLAAILAAAGVVVADTSRNHSKASLWGCAYLPHADNITIDTVLGEWFVHEMAGNPDVTAEKLCSYFSFTHLHQENGTLSLNVSWYKSNPESGDKEYTVRHRVDFHKDSPYDFGVRDVNAFLRVTAVTQDGKVVVVAVCERGRPRLVLLLLSQEDKLPGSVEGLSHFESDSSPLPAPVARRNNTLCHHAPA